jgi:hypothetical protein
MRITLLVALLLGLLPGTTSALTVQEVVALSKAGVSDEVLLALIDRDKTIFTIDSEQLIALTRDRVSEKLVVAMLRSGRQEQPSVSPATGVANHSVPPEPGALMFGHGPSRPNTYHSFEQLGMAGFPAVYAPAPFFAPFGLPAAPFAVPCHPSAARGDRTTGIADAAGKFVNNGLLPALAAAAGGGSAVCHPAPPPPPRAGRTPRRARR